MKKKGKPYRLVACYDTETTNLQTMQDCVAFPILHIFGLYFGDLAAIDAENVETLVDVSIFRHASEAWEIFDNLIEFGLNADFIPVVAVHNLGFDMYSISPYLNEHECRVSAKSSVKPIKIEVLQDGKPVLCFWDTFGFSGQPLRIMGRDCGYSKLDLWDYDKVRTPETPLSDNELDYAKHDVLVMFAWFGWFLRRNPDIEPDSLAVRVTTKTGVVREKRKKYFSKLKAGKASAGQYWDFVNRLEVPKSNDELYTMHSATRGGFTFTASKHAGKVWKLENTSEICACFDAVSMHPSQMASHKYPHAFKQVEPYVLDMAAQVVLLTDRDYIKANWVSPFTLAFDACFYFEGLRLRRGTIFEREGIATLASARFQLETKYDGDNGSTEYLLQYMKELGYRDIATNAIVEFGKVVSCDSCKVFLTELELWIMGQVYEWDYMRAVNGYLSVKYQRPTDFSLLSVMHFFNAKNAVKRARKEYYSNGKVSDGGYLTGLVPDAAIEELQTGTMQRSDLEQLYLSTKADLNALFGIECTNEVKSDWLLTDDGIEIEGAATIDDVPAHPKAWYQYGQRIVGWSRVYQILAILEIEPYILHVLNGDTDSIKVVLNEDSLPDTERALQGLYKSVERGKRETCSRVLRNYPDRYSDLGNVGAYELEFTAKRIAVYWNKAYIFDAGNGCEMALAGIPWRFADYMAQIGFDEATGKFLGFNLTIDSSLTGLHNRSHPEWATYIDMDVQDYTGIVSHVHEPAAVALFDMAKTIGAEENTENAINMEIAKRNNPDLPIKPRLAYLEDDRIRLETFGSLFD